MSAANEALTVRTFRPLARDAVNAALKIAANENRVVDVVLTEDDALVARCWPDGGIDLGPAWPGDEEVSS